MVNQKKKAKYVGMAGALLVHVAVILLLWLVGFTVPQQQEEGGVSVMLGEVAQSAGTMDPSLVEVDVMPDEVAPADEFLPEEVEQDLLTQEVEETVAIPPKEEAPEKEIKKKPEKEPVKEVKKEPKKDSVKKKPVKPEKTEAEKAEEARKQKEAEEAASRRVAGAFGKGAQMADKGNEKGSGVQGNPAGNASTGKVEGSGGYGSFDLRGRSLDEGGLPRPVVSTRQEEDEVVVVNITVNPAGRVIATGINLKGTNTVNSALRKAAEDAAKKARFNTVSGLNNQQGTITYYFNLK